MSKITKAKHKKKHIELHHKFDELLADFIYHTGILPSKASLIDLINWSYKQTIKPDER